MEKMNLKVRKQLQYATVSLRGYRSLVKTSRKSMTCFAFLFLFFLWVIGIVTPFIIGQLKEDNIVQVIEEQIPDFNYEKGVLSSEVYYYIDSDYTIIVDTNRNEYSIEDNMIHINTSYAALFGSESCTIKWNSKTIEIHYKDWFSSSYSKQILMDKVPVFYYFIAGIMIIIYFITVGLYFLISFLYGLFAFLFNLVLNKKMNYWQCYRIGFYSVVTYKIIESIIHLFGLQIPTLCLGNFKINILLIAILLFYQIIGVNIQKQEQEEIILETVVEKETPEEVEVPASKETTDNEISFAAKIEETEKKLEMEEISSKMIDNN